ncbi:AAA family ATPase [Muricoccus vinaceus]|uniref:AAA family ATPase n=1 Tax=Muricoccus vinaceus TaxID=424704 RepID=A0ABV6IYD0_9PROT
MTRFPLGSLIYSVNGQHHEITARHSEAPKLKVNGVDWPLSDAMLPSKVIALSMTPFDKFPVRSLERRFPYLEEDDLEFEPDDVYSYVGMRDRMGRASVSSLLLRTVARLFSRQGLRSRGRIAKVFDLVGYLPTLNVVFRLDSSTALKDLAEHQGEAFLKRVNEPGTYPRRGLENAARQNKEIVKDFSQAAKTALANSNRGFVVVPLNVYDPLPAATAAFDGMELLRRLGLARLFGVGAQKLDGKFVDFKEASSGELSIAITFMSLASHLQDNSLVLIDEPETNLHPEWQSKYVDLLTSTFAEYDDCHYILATHSPLVLSDAPPSATLYSLSDDIPQNGHEVSGRPIDYLLVKAFKVASGNNYYVQEELVKALRLAADGLIAGSEFHTTVRGLVEIRPLITDNPGVIELISNLEKIMVRGSVKG